MGTRCGSKHLVGGHCMALRRSAATVVVVAAAAAAAQAPLCRAGGTTKVRCALSGGTKSAARDSGAPPLERSPLAIGAASAAYLCKITFRKAKFDLCTVFSANAARSADCDDLYFFEFVGNVNASLGERKTVSCVGSFRLAVLLLGTGIDKNCATVLL